MSNDSYFHKRFKFWEALNPCQWNTFLCLLPSTHTKAECFNCYFYLVMNLYFAFITGLSVFPEFLPKNRMRKRRILLYLSWLYRFKNILVLEVLRVLHITSYCPPLPNLLRVHAVGTCRIWTDFSCFLGFCITQSRLTVKMNIAIIINLYILSTLHKTHKQLLISWDWLVLHATQDSRLNSFR